MTVTTCSTSWWLTVSFLRPLANWSLSILLSNVLNICYVISAVFRYATPCSLVDRLQRFGGSLPPSSRRILSSVYVHPKTATNTCRTIKTRDITCDKTVIITLFVERRFSVPCVRRILYWMTRTSCIMNWKECWWRRASYEFQAGIF
jgi:hypothetical protein